jgi:transposase
VLRSVRFKDACRHCERCGAHAHLDRAHAGANAPGQRREWAIIAKYPDGTPLYRMEDALGRSTIAVSLGTLAYWIIRPAELHLPGCTGVARYAARAVDDPWRRDDGAGA